MTLEGHWKGVWVEAPQSTCSGVAVEGEVHGSKFVILRDTRAGCFSTRRRLLEEEHVESSVEVGEMQRKWKGTRGDPARPRRTI